MYRSPPKADWRTDGWMKEEEEKDGEGDFVLWKSQDLGESTPKVCSSAPLAHTAPLFGSAFPDHDVGSIPSMNSSSSCPSTLPATVSRLLFSSLVLFALHMAEEERGTFRSWWSWLDNTSQVYQHGACARAGSALSSHAAFATR